MIFADNPAYQGAQPYGEPDHDSLHAKAPHWNPIRNGHGSAFTNSPSVTKRHSLNSPCLRVPHVNSR